MRPTSFPRPHRFVRFTATTTSRAVVLALVTLTVLSTLLIQSCQSTSQPTTMTTEAWTDAKIFEVAKVQTGTVWYKNSDAALNRGKNTGHAEPFLRTRYNTTAAQMLDAGGKVKAGATFAEGSIIVKELLASDKTTVSGYAVMIKQKNDPSADANGWVWGYLTGAGAVRDAVSRKGAGCIGCHSISGHIDQTLMNLDHP